MDELPPTKITNKRTHTKREKREREREREIRLREGVNEKTRHREQSKSVVENVPEGFRVLVSIVSTWRPSLALNYELLCFSRNGLLLSLPLPHFQLMHTR